MRISKYIPSMYQRRLLLIVVGIACVTLPPAVQMLRLTLWQGEAHRAAAERHLVSERWLPSVRGEIRDRKGRVLALDRPSLDIAVEYPIISGEWAEAQATRRARAASAGRWGQLSPVERDALIAAHIMPFEDRLDQAWTLIARTAGITREDLDARKDEIRQSVELLATVVTERQRVERQRQLNRAADDAAPGAAHDGGTDDQPLSVATVDVRRPIREESSRHVLLRNVPDAVGFEFERLLRQSAPITSEPGARVFPLLPGVHVLDNTRRDYPLETVDVPVDLSHLPGPLRREGVQTVRVVGVATHLIGWMRSRIFKEDAARRPLRRPDGSIDHGHYRPGDELGQGGFEQAAEDQLRGLRGLSRTHLDTGEVETTPAIRGGNVELTIDSLLQARVQALFDPSLGLCVVQPWHKVRRPEQPTIAPGELPLGQSLNGAAVVLEIETGNILALVSAPSFSRTGLSERPEEVFSDSFRMAYLNRAIDKPYPPGSIVKPLIYAAAGSTGVFPAGGRVACAGHFYPDRPQNYRCWIYKQFNDTHSNQLGHDLDASDAIKVSCNIFFFELGRRLGPSGIHECYTALGVGGAATPWNIFALREVHRAAPGLLHEQRGSVPPSAQATQAEAVLMGIGQGPVTWTPLHAASAFATLARSGVSLAPRLRADAPQQRADLGYDPGAVSRALAGLKRSASEERGTTHSITYTLPDGRTSRENIFDIPGVNVWAKSGTADAPPFIADLALSGQDDTFDGDHAWCVLLAGDGEQPKYAIAVVVDHGGSGGRVAGPVANQVIHALAAEGYLPGPARSAGLADADPDSRAEP